MKIRESLSFDDVLMVPQYSDIESRLDVDISTNLGKHTLNIPLISSPMDTVTESKMAAEIGILGGLGIVHRFCTIDEQISMLRTALQEFHKRNVPHAKIGFAVGVFKDKNEQKRYETVVEELFEYAIDYVCIDIANGHSSLIHDTIKHIKDFSSRQRIPIDIIAGSVATDSGYAFLADLGVDAVRCGIGGGSICSTRIKSAHGVTTFQSLLDIQAFRQKMQGQYDHVSVIADGGIRYPKDVVLSLAAGADAVMCGGVFAGTDESPGDIIIDREGKSWKKYRGMASLEVQQEKRSGLKKGTCAEGVSTLIPYKGSLESVIDDFAGGLRVGLGLEGARNLKELREAPDFVRISSAGLEESHAYGTRK